MEPELPPVDLPIAPSWLDAALLAIGLPEASVTLPLLVAIAGLSMLLGDVLKGVVKRGAETPNERRLLRGVVFLVGVALGCASSSLAMIAFPQGLALGLIGGAAAPYIWRAVVPWLRARGVR